MVVTKLWLKNNRTVAGGWTRKQLSVVGIGWPPFHGWMKKACGKEIADEDARAFEKLGAGISNQEHERIRVGLRRRKPPKRTPHLRPRQQAARPNVPTARSLVSFNSAPRLVKRNKAIRATSLEQIEG